MYMNTYRRKKINLWLLILIILFIVAIVFTVIHMSNSSKANSDNRYSKQNNEKAINQEKNGSTIGKVDSYDSFSNVTVSPGESGSVEMYNEVPENTGSPDENNYKKIGGLTIPPAASASEAEREKQPVTIDEHTYSFQNLGDFCKNGAPTHEFVELKKGDYLYRLNIQKSSFDDVLHKDSLKSHIETTFNVQVTSELKTGTINELQMILCTIADSTSVGYFAITPFNESEVLCIKIYDVNNPMALIKDLSEPLNDISSIKANIQ